jgi:hypothetical protein
MEGTAEINEIVERLQLLVHLEPGPPAMVVMGPGLGDDGDALRGNRGGFLHLAIAALKAAEREEQDFETSEWISQPESDWVIRRLKHDPEAHSYFPAPRSGWKNALWSWMGYVFLIFVVLCLIVGVTTIARWF